MVDLQKIPYLTTQQMIEVDRLMIEVFGIQLVQMMENAGRHLAELARDQFLGGNPLGKKAIILAGSGGNGGGAMVSARNLHNWGAKVEVYLTKPVRELSGVIRQQADILENMGVDIFQTGDLEKNTVVDLIIDGIIGYSIKGAPRGSAADLIIWANKQDTSILSLDVPTGLDPDTGEVYQPAITANATITLALPKIGLKTQARDVVGKLYLADIGVPAELYQHPSLGLQVGPIFNQSQIIHLV